MLGVDTSVFHPAVLGTPKAEEKAEEKPHMPPPSMVERHSSFAEYSQSESMSLHITTQEGDVIRLSYNTEYLSREQDDMQQADDGSMIASYSMSESFSVGFNYSVEGDLNEQEQAAVDALMADAKELSNMLYDGDMEGALRGAMHLSTNYNSDVLSGFSLQAKQEIRSVQQYEHVQNIVPKHVKSDANHLADMQAKFREAMAKQENYGVISKPQSLMATLMEKVIGYDPNVVDDDRLTLLERLEALREEEETEE